MNSAGSFAQEKMKLQETTRTVDCRSSSEGRPFLFMKSIIPKAKVDR